MVLREFHSNVDLRLATVALRDRPAISRVRRFFHREAHRGPGVGAACRLTRRLPSQRQPQPFAWQR